MCIVFLVPCCLFLSLFVEALVIGLCALKHNSAASALFFHLDFFSHLHLLFFKVIICLLWHCLSRMQLVALERPELAQVIVRFLLSIKRHLRRFLRCKLFRRTGEVSHAMCTNHRLVILARQSQSLGGGEEGDMTWCGDSEILASLAKRTQTVQ